MSSSRRPATHPAQRAARASRTRTMSSERQQAESEMGSPGGPVWNVAWSYAILRFTLGTTFLLHGVTRFVRGWSAFADEMVLSTPPSAPRLREALAMVVLPVTWRQSRSNTTSADARGRHCRQGSRNVYGGSSVASRARWSCGASTTEPEREAGFSLSSGRRWKVLSRDLFQGGHRHARALSRRLYRSWRPRPRKRRRFLRPGERVGE